MNQKREILGIDFVSKELKYRISEKVSLEQYMVDSSYS